MGDNGGEGDKALMETGVTSFSQLLMSSDAAVIDDVSDAVEGVDGGFGSRFGFGFSTTKGGGGPRMLCFGGGAYDNDPELLFSSEPSSLTPFGDSNSPFSSCNNKIMTPRSNTKRNGSGEDPDRVHSDCFRRTGKKSKTDHSKLPVQNTKVRKEKIGERITTLQQLVSPYGKTDTASVLHEAMGYIKFLQEQVQVLCSPYLIHHPDVPHDGGEVGDEELTKKDLRSRGLCLVPVSCTVHVASTNGADFWSPAIGHSMSASMD